MSTVGVMDYILLVLNNLSGVNRISATIASPWLGGHGNRGAVRCAGLMLVLFMLLFQPISMSAKDASIRAGESPSQEDDHIDRLGTNANEVKSLAEDGTISGHVLDADGNVITDVYISVHASGVSSGSSSLGAWVSRRDGSYTIEGLAPGNYLVEVNNNHVVNYETKYYLDTQNPDEATIIAVEAGVDSAPVDFALRPIDTNVVFFESFDYTDGFSPPTITTYQSGGSANELEIVDSKLKSTIDAANFDDWARAVWRPNSVTFGKNDQITLEYEGYERAGYNAGNNYGYVFFVPADSPIVPDTTGLAINCLVQNRYHPNCQGRDATDEWTMFVNDMYAVSDGHHTYRFEINHVNGLSQPDAFRLYRDGLEVVAYDDISPYLADENTISFQFFGADPIGAAYTWDDVRIWTEPGTSITGLAASNVGPTVLGRPTTLTATVATGVDVNYAWTFGDGATGAGSNPQHTYASSGEYMATVTASNDSSSASASTTVIISDAVVEVRNFEFTPNTVTIPSGGSVTWVRLEGTHNVMADDTRFTSGQPNSDWITYTNTFNDEGAFRYYCELHGGPNGVGMSGLIQTVNSNTAGHNNAYLPMVSKPAPASFPQLANGSFDSPVDTSWRQSSVQGESLIYPEGEVSEALGQPFPAHSSPNLAWLGGAVNEQAMLQQSVWLPGAFPDVRLSFWHWIGSSEKNCGADLAYVEVGTTQLATFDLCQANNTGGWQRSELSLAGYVGATVDVTFRSTQDGAEVSNWFLDNIVLCDGTTDYPCE